MTPLKEYLGLGLVAAIFFYLAKKVEGMNQSTTPVGSNTSTQSSVPDFILNPSGMSDSTGGLGYAQPLNTNVNQVFQVYPKYATEAIQLKIDSQVPNTLAQGYYPLYGMVGQAVY